VNINSARGGRSGRGRGNRGGITDYSGRGRRGRRGRSRGGRYRSSDKSGRRNIYWSNSRFILNIFYNPKLNKYSFCFEKGYLVDNCRHYKNWNYKHFKKAYIEYYSSIKPSSLSKRRSYLAS
jgi:hypothetical protein